MGGSKPTRQPHHPHHQTRGCDPARPGLERAHLPVAAGRLGLDAAESEYIEFGGQPAIVVRRYDRRVDSQSRLVRIHQEDLCQAMSVAPEQKYEIDGGPGAVRILHLLRGSARLEDGYGFLRYQAYNLSLIHI